MKRIIIFLSILIVASMVTAMPANALESGCEEYDYTQEIYSQVDDILEDFDIIYTLDDIEDMPFERISDSIKEVIVTRISAPFNLLKLMLLLTLFAAFVQSFGESVLSKNGGESIFRMVCVVSAVTVLSTPLLTAFENAADSMERGGNFMLLFVPVFAGISFFSGGITTISCYNAVVIGAAELLVQIAQHFFMPLISITAALAIANSISSKSSIEGVIRLIQKIITWSMTVLITLFIGFLTVKGTLSAAADGFASKTAKFMISGFVPIVGSAVSDAYSTVKGSMTLMKCTTGTAGIVALAFILLPPVIELFCYKAVMWVCNAAADMLSVKSLSRLFRTLDKGLSIAISIMISFSLLFVISTAVLMKTANNIS